jgi:hypothetical protein
MLALGRFGERLIVPQSPPLKKFSPYMLCLQLAYLLYPSKKQQQHFDTSPDDISSSLENTVETLRQ